MNKMMTLSLLEINTDLAMKCENGATFLSGIYIMGRIPARPLDGGLQLIDFRDYEHTSQLHQVSISSCSDCRDKISRTHYFTFSRQLSPLSKLFCEPAVDSADETISFDVVINDCTFN